MSSKGTILIVEDQIGFRLVYEDLLVHEGYEVLMAEDGIAGWEMAKQKQPSLVLLDLGLPKLDGFGVLDRMKGDPATKSIPVIIFSVMGEQAEVKKAMDMGADDFAIKGFYTTRQVLSKIKSQLILLEPKRKTAPFRIPVPVGGLDAERLQKEAGLPMGYKCPSCDSEMVLEMFPDYVRQETHWFSSRLSCPQCGKSA